MCTTDWKTKLSYEIEWLEWNVNMEIYEGICTTEYLETYWEHTYSYLPSLK